MKRNDAVYWCICVLIIAAIGMAVGVGAAALMRMW